MHGFGNVKLPLLSRVKGTSRKLAGFRGLQPAGEEGRSRPLDATLNAPGWRWRRFRYERPSSNPVRGRKRALRRWRAGNGLRASLGSWGQLEYSQEESEHLDCLQSIVRIDLYDHHPAVFFNNQRFKRRITPNLPPNHLACRAHAASSKCCHCFVIWVFV